MKMYGCVNVDEQHHPLESHEASGRHDGDRNLIKYGF